MRDGQERRSFTFRGKWVEAMSGLPEQVREEVYMAIIEYGTMGKLTELKAMARLAFNFAKMDMDEERKAEEVSKEMSRRAQARWEKVDARASCTSMEPKETRASAVNAQASCTSMEAEIAKNSRTRIIGNNNIIEEDIKLRDKNIKEEKKEKRKEENGTAAGRGTLAATFDERKKKFYTSLVPYVEMYGKAMTREFFDYWAEANRSRTKMRWETEKTFEVALRLAKWAARERNTQNGNGNTGETTTDRRRGTDAVAHAAEDYKTGF